jgi:hypothetical protein
MHHAYIEDQLVKQPAINVLMLLSGRTVVVQYFIRRTRYLLLPRLLPGQVELPIGE